MKKFFPLVCLIGSGLCPVALPRPLEATEIKLPPETASFKTGPGSEFANGQCLTCHSVEYAETQPPMPRQFWETEVIKMQKTYGASFPPDQVEPLIEYLTRTYGVSSNGAPQITQVAVVKETAPAGALTGQTVAIKYGCLTCHALNTKLVGPPYKEVAAKYSEDPNAYTKIAEQIHKGGSGKWGPILMPPFPQATEAETKALADWILSLK